MVLYELAEEIRRAGFSAERVLLAQNKDGHFFISIDEKKYMPLYTDTLGHFFDPKCSLLSMVKIYIISFSINLMLRAII